MTEEKVFFDAGDVRVTNARFVVAGQTFPIAAISSVRTGRGAPRSMKIPGWLLVLGVVLALWGAGSGISAGGGPSLALGAGLAAVAIYLVATAPMPDYTVTLTTSAGEQNALSSQDKDMIERVVQSLNDAIVARG